MDEPESIDRESFSSVDFQRLSKIGLAYGRWSCSGSGSAKTAEERVYQEQRCDKPGINS